MTITKPLSELQNYTNVIGNLESGSRVYFTMEGHDKIVMMNTKDLDELERQLALYRFKVEMLKGERSIVEEGTISSEELKKELGI